MQTETKRPRGAVYALCVVRDRERVSIMSNAISVGGKVEPHEVRVTIDGGAPSGDATRYVRPFVAPNRVRAVLFVAGERVVEADTTAPSFRIAGSTAPVR